MVTDESRLENGAQVAVIGGGPAGCFFALHLLDYAKQARLQLRVTLFETRDFTLAGPRNCGKCAGILSYNLQKNLREFGLQVPETVVQDKIDSYVLHLASESAEIFPPMPDRDIVSVYRGRGPRLAPLSGLVNFDEWLLKEVEQAGAKIVACAVQSVTAADRPLIQTKDQTIAFDLVVLATGINSRRLQLEGFAYRPPKTEFMIQDEMADFNDLSRRVHIYFDSSQGMFFGAVVPKGGMASITILSPNPNRDTVRDFVPQVAVCGGSKHLCGCKPKVSIAIAQNYYANRFVAIGDAAATRLYKDGIGSAFLTGRQAAYTAVHHGLSATAFRRHYAPTCRKIALDNFFGRLLFLAWNLTSRFTLLNRLWLYILDYELTLPPKARRYHRALWNIFTGDDTYQRVFLSLTHPRVAMLLLKTAWHMWRHPKSD